MAIVLPGERGRIRGVAYGWAGPLAATARRQVLARLAPRACRHGRTADAHPALSTAQLSAEAGWQLAEERRSVPPRVCGPARRACTAPQDR